MDMRLCRIIAYATSRFLCPARSDTVPRTYIHTSSGVLLLRGRPLSILDKELDPHGLAIRSLDGPLVGQALGGQYMSSRSCCPYSMHVISCMSLVLGHWLCIIRHTLCLFIGLVCIIMKVIALNTDCVQDAICHRKHDGILHSEPIRRIVHAVSHVRNMMWSMPRISDARECDVIQHVCKWARQ